MPGRLIDQCSVRKPINVERLFYFAQRAVLHPRAPLYDTRYVLAET